MNDDTRKVAMLPVKPTSAMIAAGRMSLPSADFPELRDVWEAMVEAHMRERNGK